VHTLPGIPDSLRKFLLTQSLNLVIWKLEEGAVSWMKALDQALSEAGASEPLKTQVLSISFNVLVADGCRLRVPKSQLMALIDWAGEQEKGRILPDTVIMKTGNAAILGSTPLHRCQDVTQAAAVVTAAVSQNQLKSHLSHLIEALVDAPHPSSWQVPLTALLLPASEGFEQPDPKLLEWFGSLCGRMGCMLEPYALVGCLTGTGLVDNVDPSQLAAFLTGLVRSAIDIVETGAGRLPALDPLVTWINHWAAQQPHPASPAVQRLHGALKELEASLTIPAALLSLASE